MPEVTGVLKLGQVNFAIERRELERDVVGKYEYVKSRIYLDPDIKGPQAEITLAHEITHDWIGQSGVEHMLKPAVLEAVCDAVGQGLVALLYANPHFMEVLAAVRDGK